MNDNKMNVTFNTNEIEAEQQTVASKVTKVTYIKPELKAYGDVRDITLGSSIGVNESGCSGIECLNNGPFS